MTNCNVHVFNNLNFSNKFGFIQETVFSYKLFCFISLKQKFQPMTCTPAKCLGSHITQWKVENEHATYCSLDSFKKAEDFLREFYFTSNRQFLDTVEMQNIISCKKSNWLWIFPLIIDWNEKLSNSFKKWCTCFLLNFTYFSTLYFYHITVHFHFVSMHRGDMTLRKMPLCITTNSTMRPSIMTLTIMTLTKWHWSLPHSTQWRWA